MSTNVNTGMHHAIPFSQATTSPMGEGTSRSSQVDEEVRQQAEEEGREVGQT